MSRFKRGNVDRFERIRAFLTEDEILSLAGRIAAQRRKGKPCKPQPPRPREFWQAIQKKGVEARRARKAEREAREKGLMVDSPDKQDHQSDTRRQ